MGLTAPISIFSTAFSVASASTMRMSTSPESGFRRPATTRSNTPSSSIHSKVGKTVQAPSRSMPMRTPATGPSKGMPASMVAIEAPLMARTSGGLDWSADRVVMRIWTSLRSPSANVGRIGRSTRRQVRIAFSEGRPSRLKNEPGMRPAAYIFSSKSTVRGKKSRCSLGARLAVEVTSRIVSPRWQTTEPPACPASLPDSSMISTSPILVDAEKVPSFVMAVPFPCDSLSQEPALHLLTHRLPVRRGGLLCGTRGDGPSHCVCPGSQWSASSRGWAWATDNRGTSGEDGAHGPLVGHMQLSCCRRGRAQNDSRRRSRVGTDAEGVTA